APGADDGDRGRLRRPALRAAVQAGIRRGGVAQDHPRGGAHRAVRPRAGAGVPRAAAAARRLTVPMASCVFCDIVAGRSPATVVYRDEEILAFHDLYPKAPVHLLV